MKNGRGTEQNDNVKRTDRRTQVHVMEESRPEYRASISSHFIISLPISFFFFSSRYYVRSPLAGSLYHLQCILELFILSVFTARNVYPCR